MHERIRGFTLIELLLSVIVISVGLVGIMTLFDNATRGAMQLDLNTTASALAHEKLEQVIFDKWRNGYSSIDSSDYPTEGFSGDLGIYTRSTSITEVSNSDFTTLEAGSGYKRVEVTVSWGSEASERIVIPTVVSSY